MEHHDGLRTIYPGGRGIICPKEDAAKLFEIKAVDLKNTLNYQEMIEREANALQSSLNLETGPLVKLGLFVTENGDHLLIVMHHLIVDGVSWRILFEDFTKGYMQISNNEEMSLQDKTQSFKEWAEHLEKYADSKEFLKQKKYWKKLEEEKISPVFNNTGETKYKIKDSLGVSIDFSEEETERLITKVSHAYNTEINDILLTILGYSLKEWSGESKVLISLEGHGREQIDEHTDITRTTGWFTSMYPVVLDMSKSDDMGYQIKYIKESLRKIPDKGIGYGILKYLTSDENKNDTQFTLKPKISFNYLGGFEQDTSTDLFTVSNLPGGSTVSLDSEKIFSIDINGMVINNRLVFTIIYNPDEYESQSMDEFADMFKTYFTNVVEHCTSKEVPESTPIDFGSRELIF